MTSVTGADGAPSPLPTRAIMNYGATIATRRALPFGMSERAHKTLAHTPDTAKKKIKNVLSIGNRRSILANFCRSFCVQWSLHVFITIRAQDNFRSILDFYSIIFLSCSSTIGRWETDTHRNKSTSNIRSFCREEFGLCQVRFKFMTNMVEEYCQRDTMRSYRKKKTLNLKTWRETMDRKKYT